MNKRKQIEQVLSDLYDSALIEGEGDRLGLWDKNEEHKATALDEATDKILLIKELRIQPIIKWYWWPSQEYRNARRWKTGNLHPWLPCCYLVDGYRYFRGNLEVNIQGIPIEERCRYE